MRWLSLLSCLLAACYSNSLLQEPNPLPPGKVRVGIGVQSFADRGGAAPELGLRVGLAEHVEARVKGTLLGGDLGLNAELHEDPRFRVVTMPMGKFYKDVLEDSDSFMDEYAPPSRNIVAASVPVIGSVRSGPAEFFAGPDLHAGRRGTDRFAALGGHVGAAIALGEHAHVIPECSLLWSFAGVRAKPETVDRAASYQLLSRGDVSGQCGLGFTFGARHERGEL
jgi:hypothetical protein